MIAEASGLVHAKGQDHGDGSGPTPIGAGAGRHGRDAALRPTAFRVARIYATLAADGLSANLKLGLDEQEFKCLLAPVAFAPVPNAWGRQGWTAVLIARLDEGELASALETAWKHPLPRGRASTRRGSASVRKRAEPA